MNPLIEMGQVFARRIGRVAAALLVLSAVATTASGQQFTIGPYQLQSSTRVTLTQYDYTYTAQVINNGGAAQNVVGTVTSSSPNTVVIKGTVDFGSVPAGGTITSTDTFVISQNRTYAFNPASLTWTFNSAADIPTANAGPNQTAAVGSTVTLNGTGSTDPQGLPLTYLWSIVSAPANNTSTITNPTASMPTLKIDVEGNYVLQLIVNNGSYSSSPSTVTISTTHTAPTANAGPNQTGAVGTTIQLDGSGSVDPDGNPLTYAWTLISLPSGSTATLSSATAVKPTFTLDKFGTYIAQLIVSDAYLSSTPGTVTITTTHTPPIANAGVNQSVTVGSTVTLNGSQSKDIDGFPLTYSWSLISIPTGSAATLAGATTVSPTFVLDVAGTYVAQLIVNDGYNSSVPATVTISTSLLPPVANAGSAQTVPINSLVQLNGSGSTDPNHLALTYLWSFLSVPAGSTSILSSTTAINPTFTAQKEGTYVVQLIVNNGTFSSTPSTVAIDVPVPTPVANAGPNQTVAVGSTVNLTGLASSDPAGNPLTYAWSFVSFPGTAPTLNNATSATPSFVAATAGTYVVQLIVNNGTNSSTPSTVQITAAAPSATVSVPSLTFSNQAINTSSAPQTVTFTNTGTVPITMNSVGATGDFANQFVSTCGSSVAVANYCTASVVFSPTALGARTGTLSFNDNIAGSPQTVGLSGTGIAGTATKLAFAVQPSNTPAGASISPAVTVTVEDASGNTVTSATTSVTLTLGANPGSASLSGTTTVAAVNGVATFSNLSINKIGTGYTLAASATGLTAAASTAFNVTAGTASKLVFGVQPSNTAAGASITPAVTVTVEDAGGNTVTSATNSVTLAIGTNPGSGSLSGTTTVAAVNGVATFSNLSINDAGTGYALAASATGLSSAASTAFNVTAGTATKLAFSVQPSNTVAGASISPAITVTIEDTNGNTVTSATNSLTLAIGANPGSGSLSGTTTIAAVNGVATFSTLSINKAGTGYTLAASATGLTSATSTAFNITGGTASKLAFVTQPSNTPPNAAITPAVTVAIEDSNGNTVTTSTASVAISIAANPGTGTLGGTTTVSAVAGVASFANLTISSPGTGYTLSAASTGLTAATSAAFNVAAGPAAKLAFTTQPTNTNAGATINQIQVTVEDAGGNPVTTSTSSVSLAIGTNPAGGTLSGTLTAAAVNGVATFTGLSINNAGTGYTLTAASTGLTSATSSSFNIIGSAITLTVNGPLMGIGSTLSGSFTLGSPAPVGGVVVSLTSSIPANVTISPATVSVAQGQTTGSFTYTGVAAGASILSASATGYVTGTASVTGTSSLISFGAIPTIALGGTQSLPISLGTAAPTGGLTITLTSSNTSIATVTSSIFIAAGSTVPAANPQVSGVAIGSTTITATGSGFAPASGPVTVSTTANITPSPLNTYKGVVTNAALTISGAAPAGGLTFTLSSDNTAYATVPATVTILAGSTSTAIPVTGTGVGSTTIRADYPGIPEATDPVNVAAPATISVGSPIVGNNTYTTLSVSLTAPATANGTMTITSGDSAHFLLSTSATSVGLGSITVPITLGSASVPTVYIQGLNYSGTTAITTTITASATGYANATGVASLYPTGLSFLQTTTLPTTSFSSPTAVNVYLVLLTPGTLTGYTYGYPLGPQAAPISSAVMSSTTSVGTITGSPATIPVGSSTNTNTVDFQPLTPGTTTLTLTQPAGYSTPSGGNYSSQQIAVTVTSPGAITVGSPIVGNNTYTTLSLSLPVAPISTGTTMTITSGDSAHFLLSTNATTIGSASVTVTLTKGSTSVPTVYIQGLNYSGTTAITTTITASATGYTNGTGTASLYPTGLSFLQTTTLTTTSFSSPSSVTVYLVLLNPGTLTGDTYGYLLGPQAAPISSAVVSSNTSVGTITGSPATIPVGSSTNTNTVNFQPVTPGTTTLTLTQPAGYSTPSGGNYSSQQIAVTVTSPGAITVGSPIVGNNTYTTLSLSLPVAPISNETMTITSGDSAHFLLSTSATAIGSASVTVTLTKGSASVPTVYIQGLNYSGTTAITTTITASATGYANATGVASLYPTGLSFLQTTTLPTTSFSSPTAVNVYLVLLTPGTLTGYTYGYPLGPQAAPISSAVMSSTTSAGTITGSPATIPVGSSTNTNTVDFQPLTVGTTTLTLTQPAGYYTPSGGNYSSQQIVATVSAPLISISSPLVGNNTYTSLSISLGAAPPSNETMTITSSDSTHFLLSASATAIGSASVTVTLTRGSASVPTIYVQGLGYSGSAAFTATVTASAPGYVNGTGTMTLYPTGLSFLQTSTLTTTSTSSPSSVTVYLVLLNPGTLTGYTYGYPLGPQAAPISSAVVSSNTSVGTITGSPAMIPVGSSTNTNTVNFQPVTPGTTTLTLTQPAGYSTPSGGNYSSQQIAVTVTP